MKQLFHLTPLGVLLVCLSALSACSGGSNGEGEDIYNDYIQLRQGGTSISLGSTDRGTSVDIQSNCSWEITIDEADAQAWPSLKVTPTSGTGNQNINITTDANTTTSERTARLRFTSTSGGATPTFTVVQAAGELSLKVSPQSHDFQVDGEEFTFKVTGNTDWAVDATTVPEWCEIVSGGTGQKDVTTELKVRVAGNPETTAREQEITIKGEISTSFTVRQPAKNYTLSVSPSVLSMDATGETQGVTLTCNGAWRLSVDRSWCTVSKRYGTSNVKDNGELIDITVEPNYTLEGRSAVVTIVAGNDAKSEEVSITQLAGELPVFSSSLQYTLGDDKAISLKTSYTSMFDLTEYGICYGREPNPTEKRPLGSNGGTSGDITTTLTDLEDGAVWYIRAYVVSPVGTVYSNDVQVELKGKQPGKNDNISPSA